MSVVIDEGQAVPVFATPLNPDRPNLLVEAERLAKLLGLYPLVPWQRRLIALITEYEECDHQGCIVPFYNRVTVSINRQVGKTEGFCLLCYVLRFCGFYAGGGQMMVYGAQTASDAVRVWETKLAKRLLASDFGQVMGFFFSGAPIDPHLRMAPKGARDFTAGKVSIIANKSGSGLGLTSDFVFLDEARQYGDSSREEDLVPQMNTRPAPQLIVCSTMGNASSIYFNAKVDAGRELAVLQQAGKAKQVRRAYVEYGVGDVRSEDYDPADRQVWARAHPLLGYCNWDEERMADEYDRLTAEDMLDLFRNQYLNQRLLESDAPAVPIDMLETCEGLYDEAEGLGDRQVLGLHASPESRFFAASLSGQGQVKVIRSGYDGTDIIKTEKHLVLPWLDKLLDSNPQIRQVWYLNDSEVGAGLEGYRKQGCLMVPIQFGQYKNFCAALLTSIALSEIRICYNQFLRSSVYSAFRQEASLGRNWFWKMKPDAYTGIDELVAVTLSWGAWQNYAKRPPIVVR